MESQPSLVLPEFVPHPDALKRDRTAVKFDFSKDKRDLIPGISVAMIVMHPPIDRLAALTTFLLPSVNEIIIVDTGSSDEDVAIMEGWQYPNTAPVRVLHRDFVNFSNARNQGLMQARSEWTLIIDPDELPSMNFMDHITRVAADDQNKKYRNVLGFTHLSLNWWAGKLGPTEEHHWHVRFWRTRGTYMYRPVHELVALNGRQESGLRGKPELQRAPGDAYVIHSKGAADIVRSDAFYKSMGNRSVP